MENVKFLMGDAGQQGDPIRLARRSACQVSAAASMRKGMEAAYNTKGMHASDIHPDRVASGGDPPQSKLGQ